MRAVTEAAELKRSGINDRGRPGDEVRHQPSRSRSDAESMPGEAGGNEEAWFVIDGGHYWDCIRCNVDHPAPTLRHAHFAECREGGDNRVARLAQDWFIGWRIE